MLTMRHAVPRERKNVTDVDENSPMIQPAFPIIVEDDSSASI